MPDCCSSTGTACAPRTRCSPRRRRSARGRGSGGSFTSRWRASVADEELRALHLALATERPDAELAATVAAAAAGASARGARQEAVQLAEHALRLTPPESQERGERLLGARRVPGDGRRAAAGDGPARRPSSTSLPRGPRARACVAAAVRGRRRHGPRRIRAPSRRRAGGVPGRPGAARVRAGEEGDQRRRRRRRADPRGRGAGRWRRWRPRARGPEVRALRARTRWAGPRSLRGRPIDDLCERFRAASDAAFYIAGVARAGGGPAARLARRGRAGRGRRLTRLLSLADEQGEPTSYALQRLHLCELELRAGGVGRGGASPRRVGRVLRPGDADLADVRALPRAARRGPRPRRRGGAVGGEGDRGAPTRPAAAGTSWRRCGRAGSRRCSRTSRSGPRRACARSGSTRGARGSTSPVSFPVAPELVEALAELGELDRGAGGDRPPARAGRAAGASVGARDCEAVRRARAAHLRYVRRGTRPRRSRRRRTTTTSSACASTRRGRCSASAGRSAV